LAINTNEYYYQICIKMPRDDALIFWKRNEKIPYDNKEELKTFIKNNLPGIERFHRITDIIADEVPKENLIELDNWYIANSKPKDYTVVSN